jgi:glutathione S-transferase
LLTLFHCISARSFRPLWLLEELAIPYELKMLPFPPRAFQRDFLEINPLGTVPLLIDGNTRMTESAAMCEYLCVRHGPTSLHVSSTESEFGNYLNYLHFGEATLTFPQTLILRYAHFESVERQIPIIAEDYTKWFLARLKSLEPIFQENEFLCADRFTAADISVGYALLLATHLGLSERFTTCVGEYWKRLQQRPAYLNALKAQHESALKQGISTIPSPDYRPFAKAR